MAVCPACGSPLIGGELFCGVCGQRLAPPAPSAPAQTAAPVQPQPFAPTSAPAQVAPAPVFAPVPGGAPAAVQVASALRPRHFPWAVLASILAVLVVAGVAGVVIYKKAGGPQPASVLTKFQDAYNSHDLDALSKCYDPKVQKFSNGLSSGILNFFGLSGGSYSDMAPYVSELLGSSGFLDDMGTIKMTELRTTRQGADRATVYYNATVTLSDGSSQTMSNQEMDVVRVDGQWYVAALQNSDKKLLQDLGSELKNQLQQY